MSGQRQPGNVFLSKVAFEQRPSRVREKLHNLAKEHSGKKNWQRQSPEKNLCNPHHPVAQPV